MRNVLLTGATGFVGRQVLKALQEIGVRITIIARPGWQEKIKCRKNIISVINTCDLFSESIEWWADTCKGIDVIIHVAWYAEHDKYLLSSKNIDCLQGTLSLAKGAALAKVQKIVGIGTCFEYDFNAGMIGTDALLKPTTPYAAAKVATYTMLSQWLPQQNIKFAWCRLFYLYGENEDKRRLVAYIKSRLEKGKSAKLTSGNQIRDFMDVKDAGETIVNVARSNTEGAVNICSGTRVTVRQFAEKIANEYNGQSLLVFGARPDNLTDPACIVGIKTKIEFNK